MSNLVNLTEYRRKLTPVFFDRRELNRLLSVYSRRVIGGEWKDYAISQGDGMASFSIFRNTSDKPIFTVIKYAPGTHGNGDYLVCSGGRRIKRGKTLTAVLDIFAGHLKLVSP